jgi:diazepam-binding inhibitor (GABA receptor modulating acyl-CoA-binding protein)
MDFETAAKTIKDQGKNLNLTNDDLLALYGLYKQATVGDNKEAEPGYFSFEAKAKWGAWTKAKGKAKDQA